MKPRTTDIAPYRAPLPIDVLTEAISKTREPAKLAALFARTPLLREAALNLAGYVLDVVPTRCGARPLIEEALDRAWAEYCDTPSGASMQIKRARAFTIGMLAVSTDITHTRIGVNVGQVIKTWDPGPESLAHFLKDRIGLRPIVEFERWLNFDDEQGALLMTARILPWPHIVGIGGDLHQIALHAASLREHA